MIKTEKIAAHVAATLGGHICGKKVLCRVYNTALEMMQDRKLSIVDSCSSTKELLHRIEKGEIVLRGLGAGAPFDNIMVFIDTEERTGVKTVRALREEHGEAGLCIINADGATPFTRKEVMDCDHIEFWMMSELFMNPTRHALVPLHTALTPEETERMQHERCIQSNQWPTILLTDIIVRWYRFRKGTVIRINRSGIAQEKGDYFRKVE